MADPYASHLPVLKALAEFVPLNRVLEYGSGKYSTPFFLEHADKLVTIEADPEWRAKYPHAQGSEADVLVGGFDLVFIDDGQNAAEREETILAVLSQAHPLTIIHDAEVYADVIREHAGYHFVFRFEIPYTALCWVERPDLDLAALAKRVAG